MKKVDILLVSLISFFLLFTIISAYFYVISLGSGDFIFQNNARYWLIGNVIALSFALGYKLKG